MPLHHAASPSSFHHRFSRTPPPCHSSLLGLQLLDDLWFFGNVLSSSISAPPSLPISAYPSIELIEVRSADRPVLTPIRCAGCEPSRSRQNSPQIASPSLQADESDTTSAAEQSQENEQKSDFGAKRVEKGKGKRSKSMTCLESQVSPPVRFGSSYQALEGCLLSAGDSTSRMFTTRQLPWRLPVTMEEAASMKEHLKFWAHAVATTVRQEC